MTTPNRRFVDPHELHSPAAWPEADPDLGDGTDAGTFTGAGAGPPAGAAAGRSRWSPWLAIVMLAVMLAVGVVVNTATADDNPHPGAAVSFAVGEDLTVGNFRVHVHGARAAESLLDGGQQLQTTGVWLIVDLSYATVRRPDLLTDFGVRDRQGRTYTVSERYSSGPWVAAPDTWFRGEVVFEVPTSALDGGEVELLVWPNGRAQAESAPMPFGTTHLAVDPTDIATEPVEVAPAELLPAGQR